MKFNHDSLEFLKPTSIKVAKFASIFCLGISTVIGGHFSLWNTGLEGGFWPFFGALVFISTGFIAMTFCVVEMSAALPFSGGTYGLARVTLGKLPGYLIGSCETIEYVIYVAIAVETFGALVTEVTGLASKYEPLYWLAFYALASGFQLSSKSTLWHCITYLAIFTLLFICALCSFSPINANFDRYIKGQSFRYSSQAEHARGFFSILPHASWFFLGIETLALACGDTAMPNKTIPKALLVVMTVTCFTSVGLLFAVCAMPPGIVELSESHAPLSYGFSHIFGVSHQSAMMFTLIAKFATGFGFMFAFSKQMAALQRSKLFLTSLTERYGEVYVLERGLLAGSVFGYIIIICIWSAKHSFFQYLENACLLCSFAAYIGIFASYYVFRSRFSNLAKTYRSPLGLTGAVYGTVVFSIAFICMAGVQRDGGMSILLFVIFLCFIVANYFLFSVNSQIYSAEEQAVLFIAYVIHANQDRRQRINMRGEQSLLNRADHSPSFRKIKHVGSSTSESMERTGLHSDSDKSSDRQSSSLSYDAVVVSQRVLRVTPEPSPINKEEGTVENPSDVAAAAAVVKGGDEQSSVDVNEVVAGQHSQIIENTNIAEIPQSIVSLEGQGIVAESPSYTPLQVTSEKDLRNNDETTTYIYRRNSDTAATSSAPKGVVKLPPLKPLIDMILPQQQQPPRGDSSDNSKENSVHSTSVHSNSMRSSANGNKRDPSAGITVGNSPSVGFSSILRKRSQSANRIHNNNNNNPNNNKDTNPIQSLPSHDSDEADRDQFMSQLPDHLRSMQGQFDEYTLNLYRIAMEAYQRFLDGETSTEGGLPPPANTNNQQHTFQQLLPLRV